MSFEISHGVNNECNFLVAVIKWRENHVVLDALYSSPEIKSRRAGGEGYYTHEGVEIFIPCFSLVVRREDTTIET
jgi:hypothetical protein